MKKLYLIGNLKMNLTKEQLLPYFEKLKNASFQNVAGLCVPAIYLPLAHESLQGSNVLFGAQNVHYELSGAFTGEISVKMLKDYSPNWVIVGHSERRILFGETNEMVNAKTKQLLEHEFTPIVCFGETLTERNQGFAKEVVSNQINGALEGLSNEEISKLIFAYEPVWAIGTGINATSEQADEIITYAKQVIYERTKSRDIIMLYGGSLKADNAREILSKPSIDGGLIGGASLKFDDFQSVVNIADEITQTQHLTTDDQDEDEDFDCNNEG